MGFASWFMASAENLRLKQENSELKERLDEAVEKLFAEIDSNRAREDSLIANFVGPAGGKEYIPSRSYLKPAAPDEDDDQSQATAQITQQDAEEEKYIQQRIVEYVEAARKTNIIYTEQMRLDLEHKIRSEPEKYL